LTAAERFQESSPRIVAKNRDAAGRGPQQAEGTFDERRLAAAVRPEQAEDRAGLHGEVDSSQHFLVAKTLLQVGNA
jgi:hypothetical protein